MKELMKIELKKLNLKGQVRGLIIANIIILLLLTMLMILLGDLSDDLDMAGHPLVTVMINATLLIWQAALISSLVIEEFTTKTMMQLYTYPIKRSTIILSKLGLIFILMFIFHIISQIIQHSLLMVMSTIIPQFSYALPLSAILPIVLTILLALLVGMTPLIVGLWMKSTVAPVLTSIAVTAVLSNTVDMRPSLMNNLGLMIILGSISVISVGISIRDLLKKDLII